MWLLGWVVIVDGVVVCGLAGVAVGSSFINLLSALYSCIKSLFSSNKLGASNMYYRSLYWTYNYLDISDLSSVPSKVDGVDSRVAFDSLRCCIFIADISKGLFIFIIGT